MSACRCSCSCIAPCCPSIQTAFYIKSTCKQRCIFPKKFPLLRYSGFWTPLETDEDSHGTLISGKAELLSLSLLHLLLFACRWFGSQYRSASCAPPARVIRSFSPCSVPSKVGISAVRKREEWMRGNREWEESGDFGHNYGRTVWLKNLITVCHRISVGFSAARFVARGKKRWKKR